MKTFPVNPNQTVRDDLTLILCVNGSTIELLTNSSNGLKESNQQDY